VKTARVMVLAGALAVAGCASPTAPVPCTVARAVQVDTLGWVMRSPTDTVGPILAWTCDRRIRIN